MVRTAVAGDAVLMALTGELDLGTSPLVSRASEELLDQPRPLDVCLDISEVTFCDCAGFNVLLQLNGRVAAAGGSMRLRGSSPAVARLLALMKGVGVLPAWPQPPGTGAAGSSL